MLLYTALHIGLDMQTAISMPLSMLEDMLATWQIMECGYERVPITEQEKEDAFIRTMSLR